MQARGGRGGGRFGVATRILAPILDLNGSRRPRQAVWWLDAGNGRNSGQVLLGNATRARGLRGAFLAGGERCRSLPAPSLQRPDLLEVPPEARPAPDCAQAVARGDQGPTVNQVAAALGVSYVEKLLAGTCAWMATYFDLDDGTLRCVPADPDEPGHAEAVTVAGLARGDDRRGLLLTGRRPGKRARTAWGRCWTRSRRPPTRSATSWWCPRPTSATVWWRSNPWPTALR